MMELIEAAASSDLCLGAGGVAGIALIALLGLSTSRRMARRPPTVAAGLDRAEEQEAAARAETHARQRAGIEDDITRPEAGRTSANVDFFRGRR